MNLNNSNQNQWRLLLILVVISLALIGLDRSGQLTTITGTIQNPFVNLIAWSNGQIDRVADLWSAPQNIQVAQQEIEQLKSEIDSLERENEELREIQGEYQLLLDLFNRAREAPQFRRLTATIIGYDTTPVFRSIIIDRGSNDGVFVGMPVEAARGLVGQVYRTTANSAQVVLITDNISSIPARLGNSRATGIVRGGSIGGTMLMDWISLESEINVGDVVLTSGLGGKFPEDLVMGRVIDIERRESELHQRAIVQPAVDFSKLEIVFVITDFQIIDTSIFDHSPTDE